MSRAAKADGGDERLDAELATLADDRSRRKFLSRHPALLRRETVTRLSESVSRKVRVDRKEALALAETAELIARRLRSAEALAQSLHVLDALSREGDASPDGPLLKFLGSVTMNFMRPAVPGDQLLLEVDIVKQMRRGVVGKAVARVDGTIIARGELTLMLKEDPRNE